MKPRKSLRDTLRDNQKALDHYAIMSGKPQTQHIAVAAKRQHVKRMDDSDSEAAVIKEVIEVVARHPKVLFAVRQNSGMSYNEGGAPVYFYRWIKMPKPMRIPDILGMLIDGRMFALEAKNRLWTKVSTQREIEQQAFLLAVNNAGGVSGFVRCADDAVKILNSSVSGACLQASDSTRELERKD